MPQVGVKPSVSRLDGCGRERRRSGADGFAVCGLFDKLIIERETWAAEVLRLLAKAEGMYRDFGGLNVSRNTPLGRRETSWAAWFLVKRCDFCRFKSSVLQPESLILAQNERWRQA